MDRAASRLTLGWIALAALGAGGVVWPMARGGARLEAAVDSARTMHNTVSDRPTELQRQAEALHKVEAFAASHTRPLPEEGDVAGLVRGLSVYLDALGVREREIATGSATRTGGTMTMPMSVTMRAEYASVLVALRHVESLPRLIRVRRLHMDGSGVAESGAALQVELTLEALWSAPEPAQASAGEGGSP